MIICIFNSIELSHKRGAAKLPAGFVEDLGWIPSHRDAMVMQAGWILNFVRRRTHMVEDGAIEGTTRNSNYRHRDDRSGSFARQRTGRRPVAGRARLVAATLGGGGGALGRTTRLWLDRRRDRRSSRVEVVHCCVPNAMHFAYAEAALSAGKHVVCEKPLATTVADAQTLVELAAQRGLVATVPFVYRFHPMVREARAGGIRDGQLGPLQLIHGSYLQDWLLDGQASNWRVDAAQGGASRAFADVGSHWCDLVEWVTGERFGSLVANLTTTIKDRPAASAATFTAADSSPQAVPWRPSRPRMSPVFCCAPAPAHGLGDHQPGFRRGARNRLWFEIDGAKRSLVFDQEAPEQLWIGSQDSVEIRVKDPSRGAPNKGDWRQSQQATPRVTPTVSMPSSPTPTRRSTANSERACRPSPMAFCVQSTDRRCGAAVGGAIELGSDRQLTEFTVMAHMENRKEKAAHLDPLRLSFNH